MPIPYHTVTEGDAYGVIVIAEDDDTAGMFADKIAYHSIGRRVPPVSGAELKIMYGDRELAPTELMAQAVPPFERIELLQVGGGKAKGRVWR